MHLCESVYSRDEGDASLCAGTVLSRAFAVEDIAVIAVREFRLESVRPHLLGFIVDGNEAVLALVYSFSHPLDDE